MLTALHARLMDRTISAKFRMKDHDALYALSPKQTFGTQRRSFNRAWYEQYGWMEYSVTNDAAFCFSCRHFIPAFTVSGFQNWRKAQECFKAHNQELDPSGHVKLKKLSDTRWACQYSALCAIKKTLPAIQVTLQDVIGQTNAKRKAEARALHGLIDEQFVLNLTLFEDVFRVTKFVSDQLQAPNLDISSASDLVQSVITTLLEKRSEEAWDDIKDNAKHVCERAGIALQSRPPYS
ncbi:hypothetical protein KUCAC02_016525 [Scomber scombrus]|uniref:TTF-type domain-containing protein n=1 Tax=Scomber scombrus TaxID=13677 RepID=A0AAV1Q1L6_SCOSC